MVTERGLERETWICDDDKNEHETNGYTDTENTGRFYGRGERHKS